jgi:class 3 adenylate cyclase
VKPQDVASLDVERPTWEGPLTALGVLLGVTLGVALLAMLVHKEFHQTLLRSMLPVKTLPYVERGRNFCEQFQTVTILFSDIVSYTNLAATMHPLEVVNMLNELYFMYDRLVERHNVYKVLPGVEGGIRDGSARGQQDTPPPGALQLNASRTQRRIHVRRRTCGCGLSFSGHAILFRPIRNHHIAASSDSQPSHRLKEMRVCVWGGVI